MPRGRCWSLFGSGSLLCSLHRYSTGSLNDRIKLAIICVEIQHCFYYIKGCQDFFGQQIYHYCNPHKVGTHENRTNCHHQDKTLYI